MMTFEVGQIVSGEEKPSVRDLRGDRRGGMAIMSMPNKSEGRPCLILKPLKNGDLEILEVYDDWLNYESNHKGVELEGEGPAYDPSDSLSTLFDSALAGVWRHFRRPRNRAEFSIWMSLYSLEFESVAHGILMSDLDWVGPDSEPWWQEVNIFPYKNINDLARCAIRWHRDQLIAQSMEETVF